MSGYTDYVSYSDKDFDKKMAEKTKRYDRMVASGAIASYMILNDTNGKLFEAVTKEEYNIKKKL